MNAALFDSSHILRVLILSSQVHISRSLSIVCYISVTIYEGTACVVSGCSSLTSNVFQICHLWFAHRHKEGMAT